jgi:CO/xanthine dehydrogenase Mo-binding subunit
MMLRKQLLEISAEMMQTPAAELEIVDGIVRRAGAGGGPSLSLQEIANQVPSGSEARLSAHGFVAIERFMVAYDVGLAVNPAMIEG